MPARAPEKRCLLATQVIGPQQHFRCSGDAVANMIDILLALDKHDRVVIMVAAQPHIITQEPVRYIKAERVRVKLDHRLETRGLQRNMLQTPRLEAMVEFYTDALGFDISDWLLRDYVWLRCNHDHHTIMLIKGKQDIDHIGYSISAAPEVLLWADYLGRQQTPLLWGPGRHGAGNDLFLRFADSEGVQVELSAELQQYSDRDSTTPPRLWHARPTALNLWGVMPPWTNEEGQG